MQSTWSRAARGAGSGLAATAAMSAVMLVVRRTTSVRKPAPERVVDATLDRARVGRDPETQDAVSTVAHVAFGAAAGALFGLIDPKLRLPRPLRGPAFGLVVLVASYEGWIPAAGILPPLHAMRRARQVELIVSHLVYGAVLGALSA